MAAAPRLELVFGDARRRHLGQLRNASVIDVGIVGSDRSGAVTSRDQAQRWAT